MVDLPFPLGRKVEHDPRSRGFAFTAPAKLPAYSVTHRRRAPILNQGQVSSCTGNALAGFIGSDPRGKASADQALAVKLYSRATALDQWPGTYNPDGTGEDTGSSGLAVCKAGVEYGHLTGYRHAFTFSSVLAAIVRTPIIVGVPWHGDMFYPLDSGYLKCTGEVVGGHEFLIRGIDPRRQHVLADNSWGIDWNPRRRGRFWLHFRDLETLLADDGDATVPVR